MKHLKEANESYLEHMLFAYKLAGVLLIHGLFPFVWETKASDMMENRYINKGKSL